MSFAQQECYRKNVALPVRHIPVTKSPYYSPGFSMCNVLIVGRAFFDSRIAHIALPRGYSKDMEMMNRTIRISVLLLAILALGACGKGGSTKAGQVVAKVNGDEITIHQVNAAISRLGKLDEAQAKVASKQVLNSLIEQQLLLKKATEVKLDRDPAVLQTIESAKRQILAQSYLEKMAQAVSKPSASEVHDYYAQNPALFENRRIYRFQELLLENKPETLQILQEKLAQGKSLKEMGQWLQSEKIQFKANESVKPAEQLPMEILARVAALKVGQTVIASSDKGALVLGLVDARDRPLSETQAKPAIESYLTNKKRNEVAQAEVKKLHDTAKIEYLGAFADAGKLANDAAPVATKAAPVVEPSKTAKSDKDYLEKGLSGLK